MTAPDATPEVILNAQGPRLCVRMLESVRARDSDDSGDVYLIGAIGLDADRRYQLRVVAGDERATSRSRTLPSRIAAGSPFTVAFGSCYCFATHQGLGWWYPPEKHRKQDDPVRLRFLCGDQIYMDLSASDGHVELLRPRPLDKYAQQWQSPHFRKFLRASPNLMLADDHEFWNNYPHKPAWLAWAEDAPGGPAGRSMDRAFSTFQTAMNIDPRDLARVTGKAAVRRILNDRARSFALDVSPLSFFLLDTRSGRTRYDDAEPHFCKPTWLERVTRWLGGLSGPGVLVLAQTLVEKRSKTRKIDAGLPDYRRDFRTLCDAIFDAHHDVLVLCGDIHWSRHRVLTERNGNGTTVHELVSSPLSRIPKLPFEDIAKTYPGEEHGEFSWGNSRVADWTLGAYRTGVGATYATLQFTPEATGGVRVRSSAWGNRAPSRRARRLAHDSFTLR